jgi:dephospho-CoA kinase
MLVVPLLVESGAWKTRVDRILTVDCSVETQVSRVMRRNAFGREQVLAIIARQATREARLAAADDVIVNDNNTSIDELTRQVEAQHALYLSLAGA